MHSSLFVLERKEQVFFPKVAAPHVRVDYTIPQRLYNMRIAHELKETKPCIQYPMSNSSFHATLLPLGTTPTYAYLL